MEKAVIVQRVVTGGLEETVDQAALGDRERLVIAAASG
jgi:hypothetical protein